MNSYCFIFPLLIIVSVLILHNYMMTKEHFQCSITCDDKLIIKHDTANPLDTSKDKVDDIPVSTLPLETHKAPTGYDILDGKFRLINNTGNGHEQVFNCPNESKRFIATGPEQHMCMFSDINDVKDYCNLNNECIGFISNNISPKGTPPHVHENRKQLFAPVKRVFKTDGSGFDFYVKK